MMQPGTVAHFTPPTGLREELSQVGLVWKDFYPVCLFVCSFCRRMDHSFKIGEKEEGWFGRTEGRGEHVNRLGISEWKGFRLRTAGESGRVCHLEPPTRGVRMCVPLFNTGLNWTHLNYNCLSTYHIYSNTPSTHPALGLLLANK